MPSDTVANVAPKPYQTATKESLNENLRRLILYEVLLEEYQSHRALLEVKGDSFEKLAELEVTDPHAPRPQPALMRASVDDITKRGKDCAKAHADLSNEDVRAETENADNGKLVSDVLELIVRAQKEAAEHKFKALEKKYEQKLQLHFNETPLSEEHQRIVEKAVVADIQGVVDDYRAQYHRERMETDGTDEVTDSQEVRRSADQFAFESVIKEEYSAADERDPTTIKEETGQNLLNPQARLRTPETPGGETALPKSPTKPPEPSAAPVKEIALPKEVDRALKAKRLDASTRRSALCLSGGGIRSATFNLGILQGLARHGLLGQFDYLSTVSGGGFAGGFLTAWMHRAGTKVVLEQLTNPPESPLVTEPHPIDHLRVFGNYLSLRPGMLSADTWTLIATVLRNLLLTWLVFVPFLLIMLMAPRIWLILISGYVQMVNGPQSYLRSAPLWLGIVFGWITLGFTAHALSKQNSDHPGIASNYKSDESLFLVLCLAPAILSAMCFASYWAGLNPLSDHATTTWWDFVKLMIVVVGPPWIFGDALRGLQQIAPKIKAGVVNPEARKGLFLRLLVAGKRQMRRLLRFGSTLVLIVLSQLIAGGLLYVIASRLMPSFAAHPRLYATFAVPLLLLVLTLACTLIAGFSSGFTKDDDQEWWARFSGWFLIVVLSWIAAHVLVLYGPSLVLTLGYSFQRLWAGEGEFLKTVAQVGAVLAGIVSGAITLLGGFSPKSPANADKAASASMASKMLEALTSALAPIFLGFLIILLAIATDALLTSWLAAWMMGKLPVPFYTELSNTGFLSTFPGNHAELVRLTPLSLIVLMSLFIAVVGTLMGLLVNTNTFSLHYMWRNRIIRAYLGASRKLRSPDQFTGFDVNDNIHMHELRPQPPNVVAPQVDRPWTENRPAGVPCPTKLFHVVNAALNLAGGDKLAWQDRKAESLTVSPLHVGSYWLGYRRSVVYGGELGISLGTSVAISGAFVSPNMGYMMTSPIVRFLMTLFNVRFGWWLGNPGAAGDKKDLTEYIVAKVRHLFFGKGSGKPFELKSPLLSIKPIVQEAFGKTNDKAPYVYLSDGGHFENLGLYEMVLRRCRFIVVSDASTDAGYSFDSLAQSIRQIRVDLGIPIEIREMSIIPPAQDLRGKYCAIGKIRYSCVDHKKGSGLHHEDFDGILIYIKASMIGDEPRDVMNYEQGSKDFPQEIIVDQWFSESQFESYRALGSHIVDAICSDDQHKVTLAAFARKVKEHNRVNFRVFKEQISFAALEAQFKQAMLENTPQGYKNKVKEYLRDLLDLK